jgi:hypothetical protein
MRPFINDGLVRQWLGVKRRDERPARSARIELAVVVAINIVLWLLIIAAVVMTVRQLVL